MSKLNSCWNCEQEIDVKFMPNGITGFHCPTCGLVTSFCGGESLKSAVNRHNNNQRIDKLEAQNAKMLAMLKEMADGGRYTEAEVRALIRKVEGK